MSVTDTDKMDLIGIDKNTDAVILTIVDHLTWDDELGHVQVLQEKINSYIAFIESKEIHEAYPLSIDRSIVISIAFEHEITALCKEFLSRVNEVLSELDVALEFTIGI